MAKKALLFIIFNRPYFTKSIFDVIKKYRPTELFVAADGPRDSKIGEKERCEKTRKITENIDWPCKVKRLYRNKNLGCKYAVSGAIDWFFENVNEGIILEDDCLPNPSFFEFCEKMLDIYRNDEKVMCISGDNFLPKEKQNNNGYFFSKYVHIWGWATWKRAWTNYDVEMKDWQKIKKTDKFNEYFDSLLEKIYWVTIFNAVYDGKIDTWDYQFVYHVWKNNGLSIMPNINLISNIGFTKDALHTKDTNSRLSNLKTETINLRGVNKNIKRSIINDKYEAQFIYNIGPAKVFKEWIFYKFIK